MFRNVEAATVDFDTAIKELGELAEIVGVDPSIGKTAAKRQGYQFVRCLLPDEKGWNHGFGIPIVDETGDYSKDKWLWLNLAWRDGPIISFGGTRSSESRRRLRMERS